MSHTFESGLVQHIYAHGHPGAVFTNLALHRSKLKGYTGSWPTLRKDMISECVIVSLFDEDKDGFDLTIDLEGVLILVEVERGKLQYTVAAPSNEAALAAVAWLKGHYPVAPKDDDGYAQIGFWANTKNGGAQTSRRIEVPSWDTIQMNYAEETLRGLDVLMDLKTWNPESGQLILWEGPPGTGKTFALRALAHAWRAWAEIHYITDPEAFLGETALYLMNVLLNRSTGEIEMEVDSIFENDDEARMRWKLIVLEDAGELMRKDAREKVGQALSRLLNTTDGLIGQGLKVIVLITTNEDIGSLHEAVARPGRSSHVLHFGQLSEGEAQFWASQKGLETEIKGQKTIAELYSLLRQEAPRPKAAVGFGA